MPFLDMVIEQEVDLPGACLQKGLIGSVGKSHPEGNKSGSQHVVRVRRTWLEERVILNLSLRTMSFCFPSCPFDEWVE
jgi:hypothetical protein